MGGYPLKNSNAYLDNGPCNWNFVNNPQSMQFVCQKFVATKCFTG